ncbi:MAG: hypothetical protein JRJ68_11480 [Deltaproteobacteria bacterium]|nr:hypothetical protein [Deltaproteobacteria bacterium]
MGPGTLANDAIAGQLSLLSKTGLILVSGEFGRRLVKNANGAKLLFHTLEIPEGYAFQRSDIENALNNYPDVGWLWGTHCETSTGVLNDLELYKNVCIARDIKLVPVHKWPFSSNSSLLWKFYPPLKRGTRHRDINYMPAVKFSSRLDLE